MKTNFSTILDFLNSIQTRTFQSVILEYDDYLTGVLYSSPYQQYHTGFIFSKKKLDLYKNSIVEINEIFFTVSIHPLDSVFSSVELKKI